MSASYLAAPRITEEEEALEQDSMSEEEREEAMIDLYGIMAEAEGYKLEPDDEKNDEPIEEGLEELSVALHRQLSENNLPPALKEASAFEEATKRCPDIANSDDHRLMFLRCERFDADRAANGLIRYWDKRVSLFGKDNAFGPLTLSGALRHDMSELSMGFIRLLPHRDLSGRAIVLFDQSQLERNNYKRDGMVRAGWYLFHAALEETIVQRRGIVLICSPKHAQFEQFDRKLESMMMQSIREYLPVRIVSFHVCHPPGYFGLISPNAKYLLGRRLRARLRWHSGSKEAVLDLLRQYGIEASSLPADIGGGVVFDGTWLNERKARGL